MSYGVGCRYGLDPELLWLWCRLAAAALIWPLAREAPCAPDTALKSKRKKKKKGIWHGFREVAVWSPALLSGLRNQHCSKLQDRLQIWFRLSGCCGCGLGLSCSSDSTPGPGTSIYHRYGSKKRKRKRKKKEKEKNLLYWFPCGAVVLSLHRNFHMPQVQPKKKKKKKGQYISIKKFSFIKVLKMIVFRGPKHSDYPQRISPLS